MTVKTEPWPGYREAVGDLVKEISEHFRDHPFEWSGETWSGNNELIALEVGREIPGEWRVVANAGAGYVGRLVRHVVAMRHPDTRDVEIPEWDEREDEELFDRFSQAVYLEEIATEAMADLAKSKIPKADLEGISPQAFEADDEWLDLDWGGYAENLVEAADMLLRCVDTLTCFLDDYGPDLPWSGSKGIYSAIWDAMDELERDEVAQLLLTKAESGEPIE